MNRLQKKCMMASSALHALLLLIVLVGPVLLVADKKANDLALLKILPGKYVDDVMSGGGSPTAKLQTTPAVENPGSAPAPQPPLLVEPPKTLPAVVEAEPKPVVTPPKDRKKPVKHAPEPDPEPAPVVQKEPLPKTTVPKPKSLIKVDSKIAPRSPKEVAEANAKAAEEEAKAEARAQAKAAAEQRRQAIQRFAKSLDGAESSISDNLSPGTRIEMPGPGGEAYANYGQGIKSIYYQEWIKDPLEASNTSTPVKVEIVIARDGNLISDQIVSRSGDAAYDRSVQNTLIRVRARRLPPFPKDSNDSKRTFIIYFNLKDKLDIG